MHESAFFPKTRLRRLRQHPSLRHLIKETHLDRRKLIQPLFIRHGKGVKIPITSMPGQFQLSVDQLATEVHDLLANGIHYVLLFGIPAHKDPIGSEAYAENGIIQSAIRVIKKEAPHLIVLSDVCFCEYTDHGHCGVLNASSSFADVNVDNDQTISLLGKQAVSHAKAGADVIAPSSNMDGMVYAIRHALDEAGYSHTPILSYSVKYASALYGPFRHAAEGAPQFGDRRTYQMDSANSNEALRECRQDILEGADMLMIKPAHTYLDIIFKIKQTYPELPLCAYHTSGEYAFIKAASEKGWIDEQQAVIEILTSIRRAGADFIITYYAKEMAHWL